MRAKASHQCTHRLSARIDRVAAAVKQAEALVALGLTTSKRGAYARPMEKPYHGALQSFAPQAIVLG